MDIISKNKVLIDLHRSASLSIEDFCRPLLDYFGVAFFMYYKIFKEDKSYILLSNKTDLTIEYYIKIDQDRFYVQNYIGKSNLRKKLLLWPNSPENKGMQLYFDKGFWNGLTIMEESDDSYENYSFISYRDNSRIMEFFISNFNLLDIFAQQFKLTFADLIKNSISHRVSYKKGFNLCLPSSRLEINPKKIQSFLDAIGYCDKLGHTKITSSELECLEFLAQGHTLKEIAQQTNRSHRTVETLLNRVKDKAGINYKSDLINFYHQRLKF